jgi:hypothetical protein
MKGEVMLTYSKQQLFFNTLSLQAAVTNSDKKGLCVSETQSLGSSK